MIIRRLATALLTVFMLGSLVNSVGQAQSLPPLTHHVREATLNGQARSLGHLAADQPMRLVLVLPLRNQPALDQFLRELYDPVSPSYRRFLTVEEFTTLFGPTQQDYDTLLRWAASNGLTVVGTARNRLNVDVSAPVVAIETAFHIKMGLYRHPTENRTFYAPDREPTADLPFQLWRVAGSTIFTRTPLSCVNLRRGPPRPSHRLRPRLQPAPALSSSFCGSDMRAAYYGGTLTGAGQSLGLLEDAGTDLDDLTTYFKNAGETNNVPITLVSTDGTSTSCTVADGCDDTEQTIDMTQAIGMAPCLSSLVMYVGSGDAAIFNAMATASPLNAQLSSSWTWFPPDPTTDDPYFLEFAAQGQNLFQASGDGVMEFLFVYLSGR